MFETSIRPIPVRITRLAFFAVLIASTISLCLFFSAARADEKTTEISPVPPYQSLTKTAAYDGPVAVVNSAITYTISFVRAPTDYPVTLGITDVVPSPLAILTDTIQSSLPGSSAVQGQVITWTATFNPSETAEAVTIFYVVRTPGCVTTTQTVTNTVILRELTNSVMITPTAVYSQASASVPLEQVSCQLHLPIVKYETPPPFPQLLNGDFEQGPGSGWTELVNGNSEPLIYPRASIPSNVRIDNNSLFVAWLGGAPNSTNTLEQLVELPQNYHVFLKLRYFTESAEDGCDIDTASVYVGDLKLKAFGLCNSQETNQWRSDLIDLSSFAGSSFLLKFETVLNGQRNSNWFLDDLQLCGESQNIPPGSPICSN